MQKRARIGAAIAAASALGLLVGAGTTSGSTDGNTAVSTVPPLVCDLSPAVGRLLDCPATSVSPPEQAPADSTEQPPASPGAGEPTPSLQPSPPVLRSSTRPSFEPNMLLVRFRAGASPAKTAALLERLGAEADTNVSQIGIRSVVVDPAKRSRVLAALRRSPLVVNAERDLIFEVMSIPSPNDAFYSQQWGLSLGGFTNAWLSTHGPRSLIVAVLDTGVDASVPDLAGVVMRGIDLVDDTGGTNDRDGHGTAVAGVIAARADNHVGGAGVCWTCKILPIRVAGSDGKADTAALAKGIVSAADRGAKVINVSMGAPQTIDALRQAVDYATAKGAIVLAAAGNSGVSTKFYPAGYPNVISVAGSTKADRLYGWSNRGRWVSVAAPGCNVAPLIGSQGYGEFCGTSSATPLVAGLVALVLSKRPHATPVQVVAAVDRAAKRIHANVRFGRIDAGASLVRILRLAG